MTYDRRIREGGFRAYLYKTARNLAIRHKTAGSRLELFGLEGLEEELPDGGSLEELFGHKERMEAVRLCLERVEPDLCISR